MSEKKLMLGNEAIARGAWEAGVKVSAAYPGTPSTEISENIVKYEDVYCEWSPNEKVAMEVAIGASMAGVRSLVSMKMVGVNVASDPLYTVSYIGVSGGLVLVAADDPGMYSSQNEQDSRAVARAAHVPVLEPSDSQEAKEFTKFAFDMSEEYDTPVILRTTTRLAHSQGLVELEDRCEPIDIPYEKNIKKNVMMPANAIARHPVVVAREQQMSDDGAEFPINRIEMRDTKIGVITSGIPYQYVREALPDASVLKLGCVNPLPKQMILDFAKKVDKLYIIEELDPIIEEQVKSWGVECTGKEILTVLGEYSTNMLKKAICGETQELETPAQVPVRPPILCPGCPHRSTYFTLKKLGIHAAGDIGCYTLGAVAPLSVLETTVCMGSSISTLHGMEKAKGKDYVRDWVAVIGDSTFLHTGVNSLMNMFYNQATGTVLILDNSTTGMTGHQDHAATGKTLMGEEVPAIDLYKLCHDGIGIENTYVVNAFDTKELERLIKQETAREAVSVLIVQAPCALLKSNKPKPAYHIDPEKCKRCGACMKPGCPAITKAEDGTISINATMCNGCGLCAGLCKFGALNQ